MSGSISFIQDDLRGPANAEQSTATAHNDLLLDTIIIIIIIIIETMYMIRAAKMDNWNKFWSSWHGCKVGNQSVGGFTI